jgi:hypothetical protein
VGWFKEQAQQVRWGYSLPKNTQQVPPKPSFSGSLLGLLQSIQYYY